MKQTVRARAGDQEGAARAARAQDGAAKAQPAFPRARHAARDAVHLQPHVRVQQMNVASHVSRSCWWMLPVARIGNRHTRARAPIAMIMGPP